MVVEQVGGHWIMLLPYRDGGYLLLDVDDPASPVFLSDTEFAVIDPELLESTGAVLTPEGANRPARASPIPTWAPGPHVMVPVSAR